jgi:putative membrane protein
MPPEHFWYWPIWFFPLFMPFFWITVIAVFLYLIFSRVGGRKPWEAGPGPGEDSALDILKKRYAKGEISKEEFEQMKRDILT